MKWTQQRDAIIQRYMDRVNWPGIILSRMLDHYWDDPGGTTPQGRDPTMFTDALHWGVD